MPSPVPAPRPDSPNCSHTRWMRGRGGGGDRMGVRMGSVKTYYEPWLPCTHGSQYTWLLVHMFLIHMAPNTHGS